MNKLYRVIDANINRASEGIRVLEDLSRFCFDDMSISEKLKRLRHGVRKSSSDMLGDLIESRDSVNDVGLDISMNLRIDEKTSVIELAAANFKRVQEALRTIEENLKLAGKYDLSKTYELYRFNAYNTEKEFFAAVFKKEKLGKMSRGLYCIISEEHPEGRSNIETAETMINAGAGIIQYRGGSKKTSEKYSECLKIREMTGSSGVVLIINGNVDIAMLVKADGVHIEQDYLPIEKVRELAGDRMIIGVSAHTPDQAEEAVKRGADYITVGPICRTSSKENVCGATWLEYIKYAVRAFKIPFVVTGDIGENNLDEVLACGAKCIALDSELAGAADMEEKIRRFKLKIERGSINVYNTNGCCKKRDYN